MCMIELATNTKLFCGCANAFGAPPNTHVCPVCLGLPGSLPVLNEKAVEGSLSRLSQVVTRLEGKGWVTRTPDPADGRYTLALLTDDGFAAVAAAAPGHVREVRRLVFDPLTKTQSRQLCEISRRIIRAIDPDH